MAGLAAQTALYKAVGSHGAAIAWLLPVSLLAVPVALRFLPETANERLDRLSPEMMLRPDQAS